MNKYISRLISLLLFLTIIAIPLILGSDIYNTHEEEHLTDEQDCICINGQTEDETEQENDIPEQDNVIIYNPVPATENPENDNEESSQSTEKTVVDTIVYKITGLEGNEDCIYWEASQLEFNEEHYRLYNFLYDAFTQIMEDGKDYIDEYNFSKNIWLEAMPDFDEETQIRIWQMIHDEEWTIDIAFPLDVPFKLSNHEFVLVYLNFEITNPQFHINQIIPMTIGCDEGLTPYISLPAYYAFANRR